MMPERSGGWGLRFNVGVMGLTACLLWSPASAGQPAFRAFWADAFHAGFKSTSQIDAMVNRAVQGNYNAIIAEVLAYQDNVGNGHGAYWNSAIIPRASDISGGIDPLAYLCQKAHAAGIEVHAWLVTYRVSTSWPPSGNTTLAARPEWLMVPLAAMGGGPAAIDGKYTLDPGSPEVQEHLVSIVRELVTNYPIDGINWDYVRYTQTDAGYPADATYENSSLARFQRITGYDGTPPVSDAGWSDFRRRTISELVRRCRAEIPSIPNPRQPLRHTADLICAGNAPTNFSNSSAYIWFQDWRHWMEMGWLDAGIPMNYKREHVTSPNNHAQWYRNWVNAAINWRYGRHMYCGQANYLNSKANSVTQLEYVYAAGADGSSNYSYYATADENLDGNWENDWSWYSYVAANLFTSLVPTPTMPWRDPATATEGTLWGHVTDVQGAPVDDATVQVTGGGAVPFPTARTDGNGYYVITRIPATAAGTAYDITAGGGGAAPVTHPGVAVVAGDVRRRDFVLGECVDHLITGFEGYGIGTEVMFRPPRFSGSTSQHLESQPNVRGVTDEVTPFSGDRCYKLSWQFLDGGLERWMRATTSNAANVPNPTVALDRPIRVRLRLDEGSLRVSLGVRETGTMAMIGADGGTSGTIEWIGATGQTGGAPQGKILAAAPGVWQTLIFDPLRDPIRGHTGDGILTSPTNKGTFEQLAFASTGGAGPFTVYIDTIEQLCTMPPASLTDMDRDGDVDQADFGRFQVCLSGFGIPHAEGCAGADFNGDGVVDDIDLNLLLSCMGGANQPAAAGCVE